MILENIRIHNFKSMYGDHYFDFIDLDGMVKMSGPVGSGKTALAEAIIYGLFGTIKGRNNSNLVSWGTEACEVDLSIKSFGKHIKIKRSSNKQLEIVVDGKILNGSSKKDLQNILEELYDVPKIAIEKMCIISFSAFNSLVNMSPYDIKMFLDNVFGFKTFTDYNDQVTIERKEQTSKATSLQAVYNDTKQQIEYLKNKKEEQKRELDSQIDIDCIQRERQELIEEGKELKIKVDSIKEEFNKTIADLSNKMSEYAILGRKEKEYVQKFNSGFCPTCGHPIDVSILEEHKGKMLEYAEKYRDAENKKQSVIGNVQPTISCLENDIKSIKDTILNIDSKIAKHKNSIDVINENYDALILDYTSKLDKISIEISQNNKEIEQWNEMSDLLSKTLRYKLLDNIIPHINTSIQNYINRFEQGYKVMFDQEFKAHVFIDSVENEISYNDLSTGQRKSLDLTIIFGILDNIISNVNFNVFFLDELFTNMDSDLRNIILEVLKKSMSKDRTIFVINHAEMADDYFNHKIRVKLENKKINGKRNKKQKTIDEMIIKNSVYEQIF